MNNAKRLVALATVAVLAIAGCGGSSTPENDHVLRIAMGSPGEAQIRVWDDVATQFDGGPSRDARWRSTTSRTTCTRRSASRPAQRQERPGHLLRVDRRPPRAARQGWLRGRHHGASSRPARWRASGTTPSWDRTRWTARSRMVPYAADVTNVLWYNKQLLADNGVTPPGDLGGAPRRLRRAQRQGHHPDRVRQQGPVGCGQLARPPDVPRRGRGRLRDGPRRDRQVLDARVGEGLRLHQGAGRPQVRQRFRQRDR